MGFLFRKRKIEGKTAKEWFELGQKENDPKEKIEYYSKCLKLDPKDAVAWFNKGIALDDLGRNEEAVRCYDKVLEILIEALKDSDKYVRWRAAGALEKIVLNAINEVHSLLQQAKELGINTKSEEENLNN